MRELKTPSVTGLERGLKILEMLGNLKVRRTLPMLAAQAALPKSSVHSLLLTFERQGYVYRHRKTGEYMFAPKLLHLANTSAMGLALREVAVPHLQSLVNRTGISAHLGLLENHQVWIIARYSRDGLFRASLEIGARIPLHCTAIGKALLAHLGDEGLHELVSHHGLSRYNDNTLPSERRLKADLAIARERGFTIEDEECELGTRGVGAAILYDNQKALGAISIVGSIHQINADNLPSLAKSVMAAAAAISDTVRTTILRPETSVGEIEEEVEPSY